MTSKDLFELINDNMNVPIIATKVYGDELEYEFELEDIEDYKIEKVVRIGQFIYTEEQKTAYCAEYNMENFISKGYQSMSDASILDDTEWTKVIRLLLKEKEIQWND